MSGIFLCETLKAKHECIHLLQHFTERLRIHSRRVHSGDALVDDITDAAHLQRDNVTQIMFT